MHTAMTQQQAYELLKQYNKDPFHLRHARTVEGTMRYFARELAMEKRKISGALWDFCMIWILSFIQKNTASRVRN